MLSKIPARFRLYDSIVPGCNGLSSYVFIYLISCSISTMDNSTYESKYATERIQLPKEWPKIHRETRGPRSCESRTLLSKYFDSSEQFFAEYLFLNFLQVPSNLIATSTSIAADQNWIPYLTSKRSSHQQTQFEAKESKINLHFRDLDRLRLCRYEVFLSTTNPYKTVRKNK